MAMGLQGNFEHAWLLWTGASFSFYVMKQSLIVPLCFVVLAILAKSLQILANPCKSLQILANPWNFVNSQTHHPWKSLQILANPCKTSVARICKDCGVWTVYSFARIFNLQGWQSLQILANWTVLANVPICKERILANWYQGGTILANPCKTSFTRIWNDCGVWRLHMFARIFNLQGWKSLQILANWTVLANVPVCKENPCKLISGWHNTCKSLQKHHCKDLQGLMNAELAGFARMATLANPCTEN